MEHRLADSFETALKLADGIAVCRIRGWRPGREKTRRMAEP
jgi:hypothetical protein